MARRKGRIRKRDEIGKFLPNDDEPKSRRQIKEDQKGKFIGGSYYPYPCKIFMPIAEHTY